MGVITSLIRANREKKAMDEEHQLRAFTLASQSEDPALKQWGIRSITDLGEKNAPNPEVKKHIPILGKIAGLMGQMNPMPGAGKPTQGAAPQYDQGRVDQEATRKAMADESRQAAVAGQAEKDMVVVREQQQKNKWMDEERQVGHLDSMVASGQMSRDDADAQILAIRAPQAAGGIKEPQQEVHVKLPGVEKPAILYRRRDGKLYTLAGKLYTLPEGAELIDKPAVDKPPTVAEENRKENQAAYAQMVGRPPEALTPKEQQDASRWAKENDLTKARTEANMRKGMGFQDAWAKAQDATIKLADTKQTAATVTVNNATTSNAPMQPQTKSYLAGLINAGKPIPYGLLRGMSKQATANLLDELPRLAAEQGMSVGDVIAKQADIKALSGALDTMQKQYAQISSFEHTAGMNLDRAITAAGKIGDTGSPLFNKSFRAVQKDFQGKPELAAYEAARVTAFTEVSKVLSGAAGAGAATEGARAEAEGVLRGDYTLEQLQSAANMLKLDMATRTGNMRETIDAIKVKIAGGTSGGASGGENKDYNGHTYHRDKAGDSWKLVK